MRRIMCGTPKPFCSGSPTPMNAWLGGQAAQKTHNSSEDAFRCYARYLIAHEHYEQVGPREFLKKGEGVLVLTKKSRFGAELRAGKPPVKGGTSSGRAMPKSGSGVLV